MDCCDNNLLNDAQKNFHEIVNDESFAQLSAKHDDILTHYYHLARVKILVLLAFEKGSRKSVLQVIQDDAVAHNENSEIFRCLENFVIFSVEENCQGALTQYTMLMNYRRNVDDIAQVSSILLSILVLRLVCRDRGKKMGSDFALVLKSQIEDLIANWIEAYDENSSIQELITLLVTLQFQTGILEIKTLKKLAERFDKNNRNDCFESLGRRIKIKSSCSMVQLWEYCQDVDMIVYDQGLWRSLTGSNDSQWAEIVMGLKAKYETTYHDASRAYVDHQMDGNTEFFCAKGFTELRKTAERIDKKNNFSPVSFVAKSAEILFVTVKNGCLEFAVKQMMLFLHQDDKSNHYLGAYFQNQNIRFHYFGADSEHHFEQGKPAGKSFGYCASLLLEMLAEENIYIV